MKTLKLYFFIGLVLGCILKSHATSNKITDLYNFSYLTIENGLPHNYIDDIYCDKQGFIWIATSNGLSRFDGYSFIHYDIYSSPCSLKSNFIKKVCEDAFQRLWIVSENGIDILDLKTNTLTDMPELNQIMQKECFNITKDSNDEMWITTPNNVYNLSFTKEGEIQSILSLAYGNTQHNHPLAIKEIGKEIWIGYNNAVYKIEKQESKLQLIPIFKNNPFEISTIIHCILKKDKNVWIGTNLGLYKYNLENKTIKKYRYLEHDATSLSQSFINDIAIAPNGQLVFGTLKGLNFYNEKEDNFTRLLQSPEYPLTLNSNFVNCLYVKDNILWVGTESGGINMLTIRELTVQSYIHDKEKPTSLPDTPVNAIYEDKKGNLWVGNLEGGLSLKLKGKNGFTHFLHNSQDPHSLSHNSVFTIAQDNQNNLWIGTWGGGINILNLNQSLAKPHFHKIFFNHTPGLRGNFIGKLCFDRYNNGMWISTLSGIYFYDIPHKELKHITLPIDNYEYVTIVGLTIDSKKRLWIGTSKGLLIVDLTSFAQDRNKFHYDFYKHKLDNPQSPYTEKINCIYEDEAGTIWLGSDGYGLYQLIEQTQRKYSFKNWSTKEGLANNNIFGILESSNHTLWISTNNGISNFNPKEQTFHNFTQDDGILCNQFYWNAYYKAKDNTLYFGNLKGLINIKGFQKARTAQSPKHVILTQLKVLNTNITQGENNYLKYAISNAHELTLHEKDKSFSISFSNLEYGQTKNIRYLFRMEGFDKEWIETNQTQNNAIYTNLDPGKYIFQVKAIYPGISANNESTNLLVTVTPYFYKTWWFYGIIILLTLFAIVSFYLWKVSNLKKQKQILSIKVKARTSLLENKTKELSEQNIILTQQYTQIQRQQEQLIQMTQQLKEATEDKINFFTSITHEFRTPITLITGPIVRAIKLSSNPEVINMLQIVERNSKSLLGLINQLLDFRKIDSDKVDITPTNNNLGKLIKETLPPFELFAKERNIRFTEYIHSKQMYFYYDKSCLEKVFVNLLSNAIKFTPDNGQIKIYLCHLKPQGEKELLYICISDTGIGISPDESEKIFNRFYQSKKNIKYPVYGQSGTGIGLYLCKYIIHKHGGEIYAKNNHGRGTSFRILLPLKKGYATIEPKVKTKSETTPVKVEKSNLSITILLVEDNQDMRIYIRSILEKKYQVIEAKNGLEGLDILNHSKQNINFIISDVIMPIMDGIEFSKYVKNDIRISHIPILILTAKTSYNQQYESYKIGIDAYLSKPFNEELLLVRIENILKNKQKHQQTFSTNMSVSTLNIEENSKDKKLMDKIMQVIEQNYQNPDFDINNFASAIGISKTLLNNKLQQITGLSTSKFIKTYRLNKAKSLIYNNKETKNMNVSEIAYEVGFNDPKYFAKCFYQQFGVLPSKIYTT